MEQLGVYELDAQVAGGRRERSPVGPRDGAREGARTLDRVGKQQERLLGTVQLP